MHEIKFRGKRKDTGEWVYGYYFKYYDSENVFIHYTDCDREYTVWVDPETVGQYTGLKDKNGVKIFEGDILRMNYRYRRYVDDYEQVKIITVAIFFQEGGFWFTGDGYTDTNWHFYNPSDREVIDNIHDNPELKEK